MKFSSKCLEGLVWEEGMNLAYQGSQQPDTYGFVVAAGNNIYLAGFGEKFKLWEINSDTEVSAVAANSPQNPMESKAVFAHDNTLWELRVNSMDRVARGIGSNNKRENKIHRLLWTNDALFDAGTYGLWTNFPSERFSDDAGEYSCLRKIEDNLYAISGVMLHIYTADTGEHRSSTTVGFHAIEEHNGTNYLAFSTLNNTVLICRHADSNFVSPLTRDVTKRFAASKTILVSTGGGLYDATGNSIYNTLRDPQGISPIYSFDYKINDMCAIPKENWEALKHWRGKFRR